MKHTISFLLILTIFASCNIRRKDKIVDSMSAAMEKGSKDTTTVQLIDSVYNFGTVTDGEKVEYSFRFKNSGTKPLIISKASATCGCTVPKKPEQPILPGETGFIKVVFDSRGKANDHIEKKIMVTANTNPAFPDFILTGNVAEKKE